MSEFIRFERYNVQGRKTNSWIVVSNLSGDHLAEIHWHNPWRKYVMFPFEATIFDAGCLATITDFLQNAMADHKKVLAAVKDGTL